MITYGKSHYVTMAEQPRYEASAKTKACTKCGKELQQSEFYKTARWSSNVCKTCYNKQSAAAYRKRLERNPNYNHERYLRKKERTA